MSTLFRFLCAGLLLLIVQQVQAQYANCGFEPTLDQIEYMNRTRSLRQGPQLRSHTGMRWIPVQFHECVATTGVNAAPRVDYYYVSQCMSLLNNAFGPYGVQFFECGAKQDIANNTLFGFDSSEEPQLSAYESPNVLNIYFFHTVSINNAAVCGYSYLPPSADRVIMSKNCNDFSIFLHEVGHYFGLYHTHGKSNSVRTDELVNGSNCQTAGDEVCDTPADPNVSSNTYGCTWLGGIGDANGQTYQPDMTNIMSYAAPSCKNRFTPGQLNRMAYTALNDRAYLTGCQHPNNCENQITNLPQSFDFENGMDYWTDFFQDSLFGMLRFRVGNGATPTPGTGPDAAFSGSKYLFLESSNDSTNAYRAGWLRSPCFSFQGYNAPKMALRLHAYGASVLDFGVYASTDGGISWAVIPEGTLYYEPQGYATDAWNLVTCDLSFFKNVPNIQFSIYVNIGAGDQGDFAIDDIRFFNDSTAAPVCTLSTSATGTSPTCTGLDNGRAIVQVNGAQGPMNILWSDGQTDQLAIGLTPGIYKVVVSDSLGCVDSTTVNIMAPAPLQVNLTATNVSAFGLNNGSITSSVSGGTSPYYYAWSNNATTTSISNLGAGTYTLTVTDSKDCPVVRNATVVQPPSGCSNSFSTFPFTNSFENTQLGLLERVSGFQTNWVRRVGATPNANTGPNTGHNGNAYLFLNSNTFSMTAVLRTRQCLNLSAVNNPVLEFYYHMQGALMGTMQVEASTDAGQTWSSIWQLSGDQGNQWNKASISLLPYQNTPVILRFRGVTGGITSDMAIDAVYIGAAGNNQFHPYEASKSPLEINTMLYPNPSSTGQFNFINQSSQTCSKVQVYNQAGALIWESKDPQFEYQLDLSKHASGLYLMRAQIGEQVIVRKLNILR
jgi:hypothetical protein